MQDTVVAEVQLNSVNVADMVGQLKGSRKHARGI
jgi:hypothetical protein